MSRLRAIGYTRVSSEDQPTRVGDDKRRIAAYCTSMKYVLVDVVVDVNVSGKTALADRPKGVRIHELIEAKRTRTADILVVTNLDRLTRESEDGMALLKRFIPNGHRHPLLLVSLDDHIDLDGAMGRFFAKFRVLLAEFERELIAERTSNALQHKRRSGVSFSRPPYGWDVQVVGEVKRLVSNPVEQTVLADMRSWRADGVVDNAIAARLNRAGVPGKRGGRWQATTVFGVLRSADGIGSETTT